MNVSKISSKGQIVIPVALRKKYGLKSNSLVRITEIDGHLAVIPIPEDPIKAARGMLRGGLAAARHMAELRAEERKIEDKKRGHD
jgi:AbrB family looped-hinge helix DNA binding protein